MLTIYLTGLINFEKRFLSSHQLFRYSHLIKLTKDINIKAKKILVWHEQGMGDTIQFSRYIRRLIQLGANIVFEVQKPLIKFLKLQLDCEVSSEISNTNFDYQSPLLSLPLLNSTKLFSFSSTFPPSSCLANS